MPNYEANTQINLAELELFAEADNTIDPNANIDDAPPLPPEFDENGKEIKYLVTPEMVTDEKSGAPVKVIQFKNGDRDVQGLQFLGLICHVMDEGKPWNKTRLRSWPSTRVRSGTTEVDQILKAYLGQQYASAGAHLWAIGVKVKYLAEQFAAQRPFRVTLQWEASKPKKNADGSAALRPNGQQDYERVRKGMKNFPTHTLADGRVVFEQLESDPATGEEVRTDARIVSYYPA